MKITKLRTNHMKNPLGFSSEPITFSWKVEEASGRRTDKVKVEIATDAQFTEIVYEDNRSGRQTGPWYAADMKPESRVRYYWRVTVWDETGDSAVSRPAWFEKAPGKIQGAWMQAPYEKADHSLFARHFHLPEGEVQAARLYITGLGVYECYLNGEKIGDEYLAPFYNDYNTWIQFQTYDVTGQLQAGANTLGIMLGNGWYKGRFGFIEKLDRLYGDTQKFLCALEFTMADGSREIISSDEKFFCHKSPVLESSIYDGEVYDARLEIADWAMPTCDLTHWDRAVPSEAPQAQIIPRKSLPLVLQEKIKPVEVLHTPMGETVLDFGQNLTGLFSFNCREAAGTEVVLQFSEIMQNGNFYNENLRSAKAEFRYMASGASQKVRPHFTFYGYRYVKVTGVSDLQAADFTALVLHSQMDRTGVITTSNEKVNQLFHNALWGQKGNFVDTPTDCPQRDERMGWTGDAQVFCATASYNMDTAAFYDKFMYDMLLEQRELEGSVPHVVPDILDQINYIMTDPVRVKELGLEVRQEENQSGVAHVKEKKVWDDTEEEAQQEEPEGDGCMEEASTAAGSCAWGDAAVIIPWTTYLFFGDAALLEKQYENMKLWVDYIYHTDETECGGRRLWTCGFHYADWLSLDSTHPETCLGGTDPYYVASAYYFYSSALLAKAAEVLGKQEDALRYRTLSGEVKSAMQEEYFTGTGRIAVDTQTALVLALYFDIAPEKHRERLIGRLKEKLDEEKIHLTTGFVGTPYLCPVLSESGLSDYAYTLLLNEDYPSWLYEVNMGATTIWERWNSVLPDGSISDTGMNSLNHYSYGSIVEWMYRYMCGLRPEQKEPGFRRFVLKPYPDRRFEAVGMQYESAYGMIESRWEFVQEKESAKLVFSVKVPFDTEGTFVLSDALVKTLGKSGTEELDITVNGEKPLGGTADGIPLLPGQYTIEILSGRGTAA